MDRNLIHIHRFQEDSIKTCISEMNDIFDDIQNKDNAAEDLDHDEKEILEDKKIRFIRSADRIYNLCIAYFESKELPIYIAKFDEKIKPFLSDNQKLMSTYTFIGEVSSAFTQAIGQFINAFPEFGDTSEKELKGNDILILENILNNTAVILKDQGITPKSESQVYTAVKNICKAAFPDAVFQAKPFQKTGKRYEPDILIPSLGCAIEYKYATTEKRLITAIDEVIIDEKGYDNHDTYKQFYAVFYIAPGNITESRFKHIWSEKNFPENWKAIFVLGN
jgi:hypothetical protein